MEDYTYMNVRGEQKVNGLQHDFMCETLAIGRHPGARLIPPSRSSTETELGPWGEGAMDGGHQLLRLGSLTQLR
jgi:hypothetical protein